MLVPKGTRRSNRAVDADVILCGENRGPEAARTPPQTEIDMDGQTALLR